MSLILEALRKSESERQLGKLPGLMSPPVPVRRRQPYRGWLLLGLVLLLGAGGGWWVAQRAPNPTLSPGSLGPAQPPPVYSTAAADVSSPALPRAEAAPRTAPAATVPPAADVAALPPAAVPTPPRPASTEPPVPEPPAETAAIDATPASTPMAEPTSVAPPSPPPTAAQQVPASARLSEMPTTQRAALPPLKLSVHVYAEDPQRRFAIIDGRRHVEGEDLGGGVRLREIQRDGVLLDVAGQPWLLERPR